MNKQLAQLSFEIPSHDYREALAYTLNSGSSGT
jgi:hypothetical protein